MYIKRITLRSAPKLAVQCFSKHLYPSGFLRNASHSLFRSTFLSLLLIILFCSCAFAQVDNNSWNNLFLFDNAHITVHSGNIFVFFTDVSIDGQIDGHVCTLFSKVQLNNANISGNLITIASQVSNDGSQASDSYNVPFYALLSTVFLGHIACYFILLGLKRSFIEQGSSLFKYQPKPLLSNGLIGYFACFATIIVFLMSAAGIPVALAEVIVIFCITLVGQAQISLALGCFISEKFSLEKSMELSLLIGSIIWEALKLVPFLNSVLYLFVIPTISLGVVSATVINRYVKKSFYPGFDIVQKDFDQNKIRDIILGDKR